MASSGAARWERRGGRQAGHLPRRPPLRLQRGGEAGAAAPAQRGVRLGEELPERDERLAEAPVEVVKELLRPGVPAERIARLRVVEQVGVPRQDAACAVGDPRSLAHASSARRVVQHRRQRV